MRSSSDSSEPWYFFAIDTTRRRLALIIRSFARRSPRSIARASAISSAGVSSRWRPISFRNSCSASVVVATKLTSPTALSPAGAGVPSSRRSMPRLSSVS